MVVGESDSNLPASATADYDNVVEFYKSKGYELVSQEPLPNKFDTDDSVDQVVTIHLKHGSESKVETKKVSLTINYSGAGDKTPASHVEEATWTRTVTTDKVTGAITDNGTWVLDKAKYAKVTSPVIDGYTADVLVVEEETVTQDNIIKEVKYTAKPVVPNKPGEKPSKPETPQNPQPNPTKPAKNLPKTGIANASLASAIAAFGALSTVMVFRRKKNNK